MPRDLSALAAVACIGWSQLTLDLEGDGSAQAGPAMHLGRLLQVAAAKKLRDLHRIERGTLAKIVADHPDG